MKFHHLKAAAKLKSRMGKMRKDTETKRPSADRLCTVCVGSHPPLTGRNCHVVRPSNVSQTELLAGGDAVSGGLNPNRSPSSSSLIALGPSCQARTVEHSLALLAMFMSRLAGKITEMQAHIIELQNDKANTSLAHLEEFYTHAKVGMNNHISSVARSRGSSTRTNHSHAERGNLLMKKAANNLATRQKHMDEDHSQVTLILSNF